MANSVRYHPTRNRIIVRIPLPDEKSKGGIIIPEANREPGQEGTVIAVGPGICDNEGKLIPMNIKVGDILLFSKGAGIELEENVRLLEYNWIIAIRRDSSHSFQRNNRGHVM